MYLKSGSSLISISPNEVKRSKKSNQWTFGNSILYSLCKRNFLHKRVDIIIAKVWLIGRAYAAAIERRKNKKDINDDFYVNTVGPHLKNSKLDKYLNRLRNEKVIDADNLPHILAAHRYLMVLFEEITELEKRSLASKYLHFHLPNLFYIYDGRASKALNKIVPKATKGILKEFGEEKYDKTYASFVVKCMILTDQLNERFKKKLRPRELDNILIEHTNKYNRGIITR